MPNNIIILMSESKRSISDFFSVPIFKRYFVATAIAASLGLYPLYSEKEVDYPIQKNEVSIIDELDSTEYSGPSSEIEYTNAYDNMCDMINDHLQSQGYNRSLSFEQAAGFAESNNIFWYAADCLSHTKRKIEARKFAYQDLLWRERNTWKGFRDLGIETKDLFSKKEKEELYKDRLEKSIKDRNKILAEIYTSKLVDLHE